MLKICRTVLLLLVILGIPVTSSAAPGRASDEWQFTLAPLFLWGMNIDGSSQVGPVEAPLDLGFTDDIFENLSAVFTVHFEASKNNLTLFAEYQYTELEPTTSVPNGAELDIDFTNQLAELGAGYRVTTWGNTDVEPIVGARWTSQELKNQVKGGPVLVDTSENWWDGFAGVRLWTRFNDTWTLVSRGDIGTGGSDFIWNVSFILDYQFKEWGSVFLGYRWLDYDYDSGSGPDRYAYDGLQQGPLAGISFHW